MKTVAVDFDGVIHAYSRGWHDGTCYDAPLPGAIEGIKTLMGEYAIFILSTRKPDQIQQWFGEHAPGIRTEVILPDSVFWMHQGILGITNRKLPAMVYIDDRAYRFADWKTTIGRSKDFGTWPKPAL